MRRILSTFAMASLVTAAACQTAPQGDTSDTNTPSAEGVECEDGYCVLSGTITESLTLTADTAWLLRGGVFIGDDVNETILTIEPGTVVYGESSTRGMLVITRGSKIEAEGTADNPIVFTSSKAEGERARGDWGGVVINGRAPVNGCDESPCESFGEGGTGFYGADQADDNSGTLKYVRIEFAGSLVSPDNELNGLALQGVGSGTVLDYIQIHMGADDCIEFFGGTAEAKHILCTGTADDNLDWTDGWQGKLQFFVARQYDDAGDNGIEADNNGEDNTALPRSRPVISNITLVGVPGSDASDIGMLIREGTAAEIHNALVLGWGEVCLDIDHDETFSVAVDDQGDATGELVIANSYFDCETLYNENADDLFSISTFVNEMNEGNVEESPNLEAPYGDVPDFRPASNSGALTGAVVPSAAFFDQVDFKGGVDPLNDWTVGWTVDYRN